MEMCSLHGKFLGDSSLTDVITFPGNGEMDFAGEICISPDYALASHGLHGTTFSEELTLYLVHGYLHLAGLNDISESETAKMRGSEKFCMSLIGNGNSVPKFSYVDQ
jgi:probable rRNA maturation factor